MEGIDAQGLFEGKALRRSGRAICLAFAGLFGDDGLHVELGGLLSEHGVVGEVLVERHDIRGRLVLRWRRAMHVEGVRCSVGHFAGGVLIL